MMPFNFGNSMIGTLLDAVQRVKSAGTAIEDELNRQYHSNKKWLQKENGFIESIFLNPNIDKNETKKISIQQQKITNEGNEESENQISHQLKSEDKYTTTSKIIFPTDQTSKISSDIPMSHVNQRPHPLSKIAPKSKSNYSDLVQNSTDFLRNIISSLQAEDDPYEMSDWENDEAMKQMDLDLDSDIINGKKIPAWACGKQLRIAVAKQNQVDGDRLFQDLPRRVNIVEVFGTNVFPYYQHLNKC